MKLILTTSFLLLAFFSSTPARADGSDVAVLLHNNDIVTLEGILGDVQRRFEKGESTEFEVRDALRGDVTGDWEADKERLRENGCFCTEELYEEAYQNTVQP